MRRILITEKQYKNLLNLVNEQFVKYNNPEDEKDLSHDIVDTLTYLTVVFRENNINKDVYVDKIEDGVVYLDPSKYTQQEKDIIEKRLETYVDYQKNPRDKVIPNVLGFDSGVDSDWTGGDVAVIDDNSDVADVDDNSDVAVIDDKEEEIYKQIEACDFGRNSEGKKRKVILPPTMDIRFYQDLLKKLGTNFTCQKILFFFAWRDGESSKSTYNPFATTQNDTDNEGCYYNCLKSGVGYKPTGCRVCPPGTNPGVRNYKTYSSGLDATFKTLTNGRYSKVVKKLKNDNITALEIASEKAELKVWGTGGLVSDILKYNDTIIVNSIEKYESDSIIDDDCILTTAELNFYNQHIKNEKDGDAFREWVNSDNTRLNHVNRKLSDCSKSTGLGRTGKLNDYLEIAFKHKGKEWVREGKPNYDTQTEDEVFVGSGKYIVGKSVKIDKNGPTNHGMRKLGDWQSDNATDIPGNPGTVVYSITKGTVKKIGGNQDDHKGKVYGAQVTITGENGYPDIFYTHLQSLKVSIGQKVDLGTPIGEISRWDSGSFHHVHVGLPDKPRLEKLSSFIDMETGEIKSGNSKKTEPVINPPSKPALGKKVVDASSGIGTSPPTANRNGQPHHGYDIVGPYGKKSVIVCNKTGIVDYASVCGGYGNFVSIDHGGGIYSAYGHLAKIYVKDGDQINVGDPIGLMGNTGNSHGAHLHFEERVSRPKKLKSRCGGGLPYNEVHGYDTVKPVSNLNNYFYWQESL